MLSFRAALHGAAGQSEGRREHWITEGVPETSTRWSAAAPIYQPIKADKRRQRRRSSPGPTKSRQGYMWDEYRKQLAFKRSSSSNAATGQRHCLYRRTPTIRLYGRLNLLFLNRVFRGPAHTGGGAAGAE